MPTMNVTSSSNKRQQTVEKGCKNKQTDPVLDRGLKDTIGPERKDKKGTETNETGTMETLPYNTGLCGSAPQTTVPIGGPHGCGKR